MKFLKFACILALAVLIASCGKTKVEPETPKSETEGLSLVTTIESGSNNIEVYTKSGKLYQGYNQIFFQIKNSEGAAFNNASASWQPLMHMMGMSHACPYSAITKSSGKTTLNEGYIVFQMAGNESEYWELKIDYTIDGNSFSATKKIDVLPTARQNVVSFTGSDAVRYVVAMVEPSEPKVALNDMQAMVFKMQDMMTLPLVDGYTIKIDPRMPGMGNHGSPNNVNLTQTSNGSSYFGKLSLTMTGYWKINLQLENASNIVVKGEAIGGATETSSIYFELEF